MKVKICGLKTLEHVEVAVAHGADYLGFVFAESRRQVSSTQVKKITKTVPKNIKKVGVFVTPTVAEVEAVIQQAALDFVQIHGVHTFEDNYSVPVIQAVTVEKNNYNRYRLTIYYLMLHLKSMAVEMVKCLIGINWIGV